MRTSPGREAVPTPSSLPQVTSDPHILYLDLLYSGNYSKRLFTGLGYTELTAIKYSEFRDEEGELYLKDTREHIAATTFSKKL